MNALLAAVALAAAPAAPELWNVFPGGDGVGAGKHVVLVGGDEEYRSEEALTQLGKILSARHGCKCTVLYAIDPASGKVNPNVTDNIPGLEALESADLMVVFTRWRMLPDNQFKHIAAYLETGKPVVGLRTATHAFKTSKNPAFGKHMWDNKSGGFGKQILGETWVSHHGHHGKEGTRGILAKDQKDHPILRGIADGDIFGTTDVYGVTLPLPGDSTKLVLGQVTETLKPDSKPVAGKKNDPMMPVAWTKTYATESGKAGRVFTTTMGASQDLGFEGTRRLVVNGCLWALGLDDKIPAKTNVDVVGEFKPTPFGFKKNEQWKPGKTPAEYAK